MEKILFDYVSTFITLTDEEKQAIKELALFKTFKKGSILLKEGQLSTDNYFILKGCIRCYYMVDGEEKTTEFYMENAPLSPVCSVNGLPSAYYLSCVEESLLLVSNPEVERISFERFPRFETICRILSEKLLAANQVELYDFKTSSPEQRYLRLLETRPELLQRVPQYQLASYLGITPQSLSRMRSRLVKK